MLCASGTVSHVELRMLTAVCSPVTATHQPCTAQSQQHTTLNQTALHMLAQQQALRQALKLAQPFTFKQHTCPIDNTVHAIRPTKKLQQTGS